MNRPPAMTAHARERFAERFPGKDLDEYLANLATPPKHLRKMIKRYRKPRYVYYLAFDALFIVARRSRVVVTVLPWNRTRGECRYRSDKRYVRRRTRRF